MINISVSLHSNFSLMASSMSLSTLREHKSTVSIGG